MYSSEFIGDGGRLVVVPRSLLRAWHGSVLPGTASLRGRWGSRIAEFLEDRLRLFTDFARASKARDWFDLLPIRGGQAITVGRGYSEVSARWLRTLPERRDYLLALLAADRGAEPAIAAFVRQLPDAAWHDLALRLRVPDEDLLLFHAGTNGAWVREVGPDQPATLGEGVAWRIPAGTYALYEASLRLEQPGAEGAICWLRPLVTDDPAARMKATAGGP
jgi:hypothetical protein